MGQMSAEQTVAIIEAVGDVVEETQPQPQVTNYGWLLVLAIAPVVIGVLAKRWFDRRKT